ncbi:MAG: hypothetical protein NC313_17085 [Butyrivibrio sp.]|nr:hypothetical protein [Butyrivibrio sp.]
MTEMSNAMLEKAKKAGSAEELQKLASAEGYALTPEAAKGYYAKLHQGEEAIAEDELDAVAGGCNDGSCNVNCGDLDVNA